MAQHLSRVFKGNLFHCLGLKDGDFRFEQNALLGVGSDGRIVFLKSNVTDQEVKELATQYGFSESSIEELGSRFLIPGFVDTHLHAPQYSFTGTGYDLPLLDWLNRYTFPMESKFKDIDFVDQVYPQVILRTLRYGTTTACYFATIHLQASQKLAFYANQFGQRALIGKVCMDRHSPDFYIEKTEDSALATEQFIRYVQEQHFPLVTPVVTPRFVPSCTSELMKKLGEIAKAYQIPIQSHISENVKEIEWVNSLYPECSSYSEVYDRFGLLNERTIMAHAIYLSDQELDLFVQRKAGISHCPVSNFALHSGILDAKRILQKQVKLGLGTDVSGGYSPSMLDAIRYCLIASNTFQMKDPSYVALTFREAFALATLGGSQVIGQDHLIGNFLPGKAFDALIVDPKAKTSPFNVFETDSQEDIFQKFIFLGDDRNIVSVFVNGKQVLKQ